VRADLLRSLEYAGEGEAVAATSPAMADPLHSALRDLPHVRIEGREDVAGVLLHAADDSWSVDATFSSRLERAWPGLAIDLVRHLEGDL
jgi:vacuolar-type H+-ATPase subunit E/Vma4